MLLTAGGQIVDGTVSRAPRSFLAAVATTTTQRPLHRTGTRASRQTTHVYLADDAYEKGYGMGKIPDQREPKQGRVCALEKAMRNYVDRHSGQVVAPEIGREFDLLAEAFEFYNLYSWDIGFGNRYGQSRTNAQKSKFVQDIVCGCAGRLKKENKKSVVCNCQVLIRLHRTTDKGWYIHDFGPEHNHHLSSSRGEKLHWPSHRNIDTHTKDIVKHLRKCPTNEGSNNRGRNTIAGSVACLVTLGHNAIVDGNHGLDDY